MFELFSVILNIIISSKILLLTIVLTKLTNNHFVLISRYGLV